jgi:hypothetical protein
MEATEGGTGGSTASVTLLRVHRIVGDHDAASVEPRDNDGDAILNGEHYGFVLALQAWVDGFDGAVTELQHICDLEPRHEVGDATLGVLLYLYEMRGSIREHWPSAPSPSRGLLLPIMFRFFGLFKAEHVTSPRQLYNQAFIVRCKLAKLSDDAERRDYLRGFCFEAEPSEPSERRRFVSSSTYGDVARGQLASMSSEHRRLDLSFSRAAESQARLVEARENALAMGNDVTVVNQGCIGTDSPLP